MAQFQAIVDGNTTDKKEATKATGIRVEVSSSKTGLELVGEFDPKTGEDVFHVYKISGKDDHTPIHEHITTIKA